MICEFFESISAAFTLALVMRSSIRRLKIIWKDVVWIFNCRETSLLISAVITSFLCTEWDSTRVKEWLCRSFITFNNQELLSLSFNRFVVRKKKHSMHRLIVWRRFSFRASFNLSSRSQIIQTFFLTLSLNFFVRSNITA